MSLIYKFFIFSSIFKGIKYSELNSIIFFYTFLALMKVKIKVSDSGNNSGSSIGSSHQRWIFYRDVL